MSRFFIYIKTKQSASTISVRFSIAQMIVKEMLAVEYKVRVGGGES
jgi:hypothetical protein